MKQAQTRQTVLTRLCKSAAYALLLAALLSAGCTTTTDRSSLSVQLEPISLSLDVDAQIAVMRLEEAFTQTFHAPPIQLERDDMEETPASPLPASSAIDLQRFWLEGLGDVEKVTAGCPHPLVQLSHTQATDAEQPWLDIFTACLQTAPNEQRITFGVGTVGGASVLSRTAITNKRARLERLEQLRDAFLRIPAPRTATSQASTVPFVPEAEPAARTATRTASIHAVPLLCLVARAGIREVPIYSLPQDGPTIGTIEEGDTLIGLENDGVFYFRVKTDTGLTGWVDRGITKQTRCPIG